MKKFDIKILSEGTPVKINKSVSSKMYSPFEQIIRKLVKSKIQPNFCFK